MGATGDPGEEPGEAHVEVALGRVLREVVRDRPGCRELVGGEVHDALPPTPDPLLARRIGGARHLDGAVFDDIPAGLRHMEDIGGIVALVARTQAAVADLPPDLVYAGFSNGAASAELLAATRPGARGAILMHGALPLDAFGVVAWPGTVPVEVHAMVGDPLREQQHVDAFAASVRQAGAPLAQYDYPGVGHLFADPDLPDFDPDAAALMLDRVLGALDRMGRRAPRA